MSRGILFSCLITGFVWVALAKGDPTQDETDAEGRSKMLAPVQVPVRQLEGYQKWPMLTAGPVDVSEGQFFLCFIGNQRCSSVALRVAANAIKMRSRRILHF